MVMPKLFKDSRPAIALAGAVVVTALVACLLLAAQASAATKLSTNVSSPIEFRGPSAAAFAAGAKPTATAKVKKCVVSRFYDGRRIVFSGRMKRFSDTNASQGLQMRFDVYRKYREHRKYRKVTGTGLGTWLPASDPNATIYVRELSLEGVETAAHYKARVMYRWVRSDGSVEFKRTRMTKPCHQRIALPALIVTGGTRQPIPGSTNSNYDVSVTNVGKSEALNVPVALHVDSATPTSFGMIATISPGQTVEVSIQGPTCTSLVAARPDPDSVIRQSLKSRRLIPFGC